MGAKPPKVARVEVLMVTGSIAFDFGDFGIILERDKDVQSIKLYRQDAYIEVVEFFEVESGIGCQIPYCEIKPANFRQIESTAKSRRVDLAELYRLLEKYFPQIMEWE